MTTLGKASLPSLALFRSWGSGDSWVGTLGQICLSSLANNKRSWRIERPTGQRMLAHFRIDQHAEKRVKDEASKEYSQTA